MSNEASPHGFAVCSGWMNTAQLNSCPGVPCAQSMHACERIPHMCGAHFASVASAAGVDVCLLLMCICTIWKALRLLLQARDMCVGGVMVYVCRGSRLSGSLQRCHVLGCVFPGMTCPPVSNSPQHSAACVGVACRPVTSTCPHASLRPALPCSVAWLAAAPPVCPAL